MKKLYTLFTALMTFTIMLSLPTIANAQTYCSVSSIMGGTACSSAGNIYITTAKLSGTSFYTSGTCAGSSGYANLTSSVTGDVTGALSYTLTLTSSASTSSYGTFYMAWVDWNNDGLFTDAGDNILPQTYVASGGTLSVTSASFTVPAGAASGSHRMRVTVWGGFISGGQPTITSCGPGSSSADYFGEWKDFTINVSPAAACSGTPPQMTASAGSSGICSASSTTLSLAGINASGYTFQWQQSATSGSGYVNVTGGSGGTTSSYTTPVGASLPYSTTYYVCQVTCTSSGSTTQSTQTSVTLNSFINCYCTPTETASSNEGVASIVISQVSPASTIYSSGTLAVPEGGVSYTLNTSALPQLSLNTTYTIDVTIGTKSKTAVAAWIDYNQDGVFESATEQIPSSGTNLLSNSDAASASSGAVSFTVPNTATPGTTVLRIMSINGSSATTSSCPTSGNGEVLDYWVQINAAPCSGTPTPGNVYTGSSGTNATASVCPGASQTMYVTGQTSGVSGITYQWQSATSSGGTYSNVSNGSGGTSANYTTAALTNATTSPVTTYYKCLITCTTGEATAIQTTPVAVTVNPLPSLKINSSNAYSTSTCYNVGVALAVVDAASDGGSAYAWTPTTGLSASTGANVTATPAATTTYTVTGTANSCTATATAAITVNPTTITFSPSSPSIGVGSGVSITAAATSGNPGTITYTWATPSDGSLSTESGATVTANPLSTETYSVTATDASGCSISGTVTVNVRSGTTGTVSCGYAFSVGSATFPTATSGTALGAGGSNNYNIDGTTQSPTFNFDFNGITYNQFGVNGNGFIWFGTTAPPATTSQPFTAGLSVDGIIAPFACVPQGAGTVYYQFAGTSPNRTLTIEWDGGTSGSDQRFDVILYEDNLSGTNPNLIQTAYSNQSSQATGDNVSAELGIMGAVNTDFIARKKAAGSGFSNVQLFSISNTSAVTNSPPQSTDAIVFNSSTDYTDGNFEFNFTPQIATPTISPNTTQDICTGASVTLTGTSTNPASPTTWLWQLSGSAASGTNNTSDYLASPGNTPGNYFYTVKVTNASGCSRTSYVEAIVNANCCTTNNWVGGAATGGGPTDWFTGANWSCGTVPTSTNNVVIPSAGVTSFPVITSGAPQIAYAQNLTINSGATLTIDALNVELDISGNFVNNGTSSLGTGSLKTISTGGAQTITGNVSVGNFLVNNSAGVTIASGEGNGLNVSGTLTLAAGTLTTNGNLTITSTSSGTGEIDDFSGTNQGSISGTLTVQRYVVNPTPSHTTGISYYFIGSPVNGATISQWNNEFTNTLINGATDGSYVIPTASCSDVNLASNSPYGGLFDYNESVVTTCNQSGWQVRNSGTIPRGQGFAGQVPNGTTLALTGTYNTGNISSPNLTVTSTNLTETPGYGWNLVSNPYVSPIHWLNVASANSNLSGSVYTYIASGSMAGTYNTVNELTYEENGLDQVGTSEAFWVEATTNNSAISFTNSMRSDGNNAFLRTAPSWEQMLSLKVSGNGYNDQVRVAFGSKFTDGFDNGYDAHKLLGNSVQPNVYVTDNVAKYCIYAIPTVAQDERDIPVAFTAGTSGQFSFTADLNGFDPTALVFLEDLQTHTIQNLMVSSTYSFTANTSDDAARFVLHFLPAATFTFTPADCNGQNGLFTASMGEYSVAGMPVKWTTYTLTASDNNIVAAGNFENNSISFTNLPGGYYTLELNMNGYTASKVIQLVNEQQVAATFVPSELTAQVGDDILFANNTTGATGYSWQFGDGAISDAVSPTHSYASAGSYQVVLTATNPDCSGTFEKTIEVASTTGINNVQAETARITGYANDVNIEFSGFTTVDEVTVNIYDLTGRKLITPQNIPTGDSKHTIQLDDIATGYYFVVLTGGNYEKAGKVFLGNNH